MLKDLFLGGLNPASLFEDFLLDRGDLARGAPSKDDERPCEPDDCNGEPDSDYCNKYALRDCSNEFLSEQIQGGCPILCGTCKEKKGKGKAKTPAPSTSTSSSAGPTTADDTGLLQSTPRAGGANSSGSR